MVGMCSYACEALNFSKQQLSQLNVCWNRAYRKAFHMRSWESVKELQALCGRLDFKHLHIEWKLVLIIIIMFVYYSCSQNATTEPTSVTQDSTDRTQSKYIHCVPKKVTPKFKSL